VYKTTLLLLGAAKPAQLDAYAEHIRKQAEMHGPTCWSIIYQADVRMRSEEFDRIRRRLSIEYFKLDPPGRVAHIFDPDEPWNTIFQQSHPDASHSSDRFWQTEVKDKCTAYLTQVRSWNQVMDDGTSQNGGYNHYERRGQGGKRQRLLSKGESRAQANWSYDNKAHQNWQSDAPKKSPDAGQYMAKDKQGTEICRLFNDGKCESTCPRARAHVCKACGLPGHTFTECSKSKGKGKDKGKKGKGKGKKGKSSKH
jgi:hypothetical protein